MLLVDTHIHVYADYDRALLFDSMLTNFADISERYSLSEPLLAMALTEREGVDIFGEWAAGAGLPEGFDVSVVDDTLLRLRSPGGVEIMALAGRQIACGERVEILGLGCRLDARDGIGAAEAVRAVLDAGGVPVLAWGVGKWFFGRAKVVRGLLETFSTDELLLGDTSLRPVFWPEPRLMRCARLAGRRILAGSDPLGAAGEERVAGSYGSLFGAVPASDDEVSADWLRGVLRDKRIVCKAVGRRASVSEFIRRMA